MDNNIETVRVNLKRGCYPMNFRKDRNKSLTLLIIFSHIYEI